MDLKEIKRKRTILEDKIRELIETFEEETDVDVHKISYDKTVITSPVSDLYRSEVFKLETKVTRKVNIELIV